MNSLLRLRYTYAIRLATKSAYPTSNSVPMSLTTHPFPLYGVASLPARYISTSKKKSDTITIMPDTKEVETKPVIKKRDWLSYGFDYLDETNDYALTHKFCFFFISLTLCTIIFWLIYYPDLMEHSWEQREAYFELRRREMMGLPLVDPNYADPANLYLPSDEELGDTDVII